MTDQLRTIALKCSGCGGTLDISDDMDRFACGYCGTQQIVERRGGTVSLKPIADAIGRVQKGTDKTASELALQRLQRELSEIIDMERERRSVATEQNARQDKVFGRNLLLAFVVAVLIGIALNGWLGAGLFVLAFIVMSVMHYDTCDSANKMLDHDLKELDVRESATNQEIAKHKAMVDS